MKNRIKKILCLLLCFVIISGSTVTSLAVKPVENSIEAQAAEVQEESGITSIFQSIIDFLRAIIDWFRNLFGGNRLTTVNVNISQSDFETTDSKITLNGTFETTGALKNITYSLSSYSDSEGSTVVTGETVIDGNHWEAEILLRPDTNTITITAENTDGATDTATIEVTYDAGSVYIPSTNNIKVDATTGTAYVNNIIIVVLDENTTEAEKNTIFSSVGGTVVGQLNGANQYQLQVNASTLSQLKSKIATLEGYNKVLFAHYDSVYVNPEAAVAPNDPWYGDVSSSDWTDTDVDGSNWWLEAIEAPAAWDYNSRFSNVKVGIVDNGFDTDHEDLDISFPFKECEDANSNEDHGTHVAGIIGATADNNDGITGIVRNCDLVCVDWQPTFWQSLAGWETDTMIAAGLIWTVEAGAKVVNFSLGCSGSLVDDSYTYSQSWINDQGEKSSGYMAILLANYDFIVVQSAGNGADNGIGVNAVYNGWFCSITSSNCVSFGSGRASRQGIMDRVIVVAAAQRSGSSYMVTSYSNGGSQVDIAAPGGDGSGAVDRDIYSSVVDGYDAFAGTSMAAPIVTGVIALVWSVNANFTGEEVAEIVCDYTSGTARDNSTSTRTSGDFPMVNAKRAVEEAVKRTDAAGTVTGRFVDATNGNTIYDVKVILTDYNGYGNLAFEKNTEYSYSSGSFSKELPAGKYTFKIKSEGYIDQYIDFTVVAYTTLPLGNIALSPSLTSDTVRIVLRWGNDHPADLDSHFIGELNNGEDYHVFYSQMGNRDIAWLDIDDTSYEGPETITIDLNDFEEFTYCVHNYSERYAESTSPEAISMATSGATVEVWSGDNRIAVYSVPTNRKGTVWNVFSMTSDGTITDINTFEYESDPYNVGY